MMNTDPQQLLEGLWTCSWGSHLHQLYFFKQLYLNLHKFAIRENLYIHNINIPYSLEWMDHGRAPDDWIYNNYTHIRNCTCLSI